MQQPRSLTLLFLGVFLTINTKVQAQTRLDEGMHKSQCRTGIPFDTTSAVNATGKRSFTFLGDGLPNPYYLSVTLNDTRYFAEVESSVHWIQGYVSAPQDANSSICVYQFGGIDAQQGENRDGCEGVLSDECLAFLQDSIQYPDYRLPQECPYPPLADDGRSVCPEMMFDGGVIYHRDPINLANRTCELDSPPSIIVPYGYLTYAVAGSGKIGEQADRNMSDFTWYDRHVQRPIPWVIAAAHPLGDPNSPRRNVQTRIVCVAPRNVEGGSREPDTEFPEGNQSGAAQLRLWSTCWLLIFVVLVMLS